VVDSTLLAFRLAEDSRILLPVLVCMDAFIVSHTQGETDLPEQDLVDRYLPDLDLPHRLRHDDPKTLGGLIWPDVTTSLRRETQEAMERVPDVYAECRADFLEVFGRDPGDRIRSFETDDAEAVLVASGSVATTAHEVVRGRRSQGERTGLATMRMFRPYPEDLLKDACANADRIGVLDRDYAAGVGGVWWQDTKAALQGHRDDLLVQGYLVGIGGGDVTPEIVEHALDDLAGREQAGPPVWTGLRTAELSA
jgi:pyruvate/2-oxoacid:ferredoxin oxidoreductase alpha subunit